jgi:hypothetical protein
MNEEAYYKQFEPRSVLEAEHHRQLMSEVRNLARHEETVTTPQILEIAEILAEDAKSRRVTLPTGEKVKEFVICESSSDELPGNLEDITMSIYKARTGELKGKIIAVRLSATVSDDVISSNVWQFLHFEKPDHSQVGEDYRNRLWHRPEVDEQLVTSLLITLCGFEQQDS